MAVPCNSGEKSNNLKIVNFFPECIAEKFQNSEWFWIIRDLNLIRLDFDDEDTENSSFIIKWKKSNIWRTFTWRYLNKMSLSGSLPALVHSTRKLNLWSSVFGDTTAGENTMDYYQIWAHLMLNPSSLLEGAQKDYFYLLWPMQNCHICSLVVSSGQKTECHLGKRKVYTWFMFMKKNVHLSLDSGKGTGWSLLFCDNPR